MRRWWYVAGIVLALLFLIGPDPAPRRDPSEAPPVAPRELRHESGRLLWAPVSAATAYVVSVRASDRACSFIVDGDATSFALPRNFPMVDCIEVFYLRYEVRAVNRYGQGPAATVYEDRPCAVPPALPTPSGA